MVNFDLIFSAEFFELTFELFTFINPQIYGELKTFRANHSFESQICS